MPLPVAAAWRIAKVAAPWVVGTLASSPAVQKHVEKASDAFATAAGNAAGVAGEKIMTGLGEAGRGITSGFGKVADGAGTVVGGALSIAGAGLSLVTAGLSIVTASAERVAHTIRPAPKTVTQEGPIKPPVI